MGGGNGAKAAQARARKAEKVPKNAGSQLKANEKAKNIICKVCRQPFFTTSRPPELEEHSKNKHSKTMAECFPDILG